METYRAVQFGSFFGVNISVIFHFCLFDKAISRVVGKMSTKHELVLFLCLENF